MTRPQRTPTDFAMEKSDYRELFAFQKAEAIYDLTYYFLQSHISKNDRTYDQMLQAARSGKQNIVEGRSDASVSSEMEIKLYGVARGSLHELLNDYLDYMRTRGIDIWGPGHPRMDALRQTCISHNATDYYMALAPKANDCELCNMILTLIYQTIAMLTSIINLVKDDFLDSGGIKEQMFRARLARRSASPGHPGRPGGQAPPRSPGNPTNPGHPGGQAPPRSPGCS